uniref:Uncharacterized protein n=1 Tax=Anguilla anguilla TaxID=7936 RepID=A0A0E9PK71_ANGAN
MSMLKQANIPEPQVLNKYPVQLETSTWNYVDKQLR